MENVADYVPRKTRPKHFKPTHKCCFLCKYNEPCPGFKGVLTDTTLCQKHEHSIRFPAQLVMVCLDYKGKA